jgi:hypothetical protein
MAPRFAWVRGVAPISGVLIRYHEAIMEPAGDGQPVNPSAGVSAARERRWGLIGGSAGAFAGVGCGLVAVFMDGASWFESGPYPSFFREARLLAIDVYLLLMLVAGLGFSVAALVLARRSPFPRSDAYGAGLLGALLGVLAGVILFIRVFALTRG